MRLQALVDLEVRALSQISSVARRTSSPMFADICWEPMPDVLVLIKDPAEMFESPRRIVVFQQILDELRYYAGGWCVGENCAYLEQDRISAEGGEAGVFESVADAMRFTVQYLVEERAFREVLISRAIRMSSCPKE